MQTTLIFVGSLIGLTLGLVLLVACLPNNRMRDVFAAIARRVGTTAAVTVMGAPVELMPGVDALYDVAGLLLLIYYWGTLFKSIAGTFHEDPTRNRVTAAVHQKGVLARTSQMVRYRSPSA